MPESPRWQNHIKDLKLHSFGYRSHMLLSGLLEAQLVYDLNIGETTLPLEMSSYSGYLKEEGSLKKLVVDKLKLPLLMECAEGTKLFYLFGTGDNFLAIESSSYQEDGYIANIRILTRDSKFREACWGEISQVVDANVPKNSIFMLVESGSGIDVKPIGSVHQPLIFENYTKETIDGFNVIVDNLGSPTPKGRLSIINGPPGTGKTTLIKGLLSAVPDCIFLVVSPDLVTSLTGPKLVSTLLSLGKSIVLVLEDADSCLAVRQGDNQSRIQAVLNLAEGIVGQLLDIRIVATTNAEHMDFDSAIVRPGRLCRHITIGLLGPEQANAIYSRLTEKPGSCVFNKAVTLAEIYAKSNNSEETAEVAPVQKIGF